MRVLQLWRYPVKSMQGERLDQAIVGPHGIEGDRHWALVDTTSGLTLTARREPALLEAWARLSDGGVEVVLPSGAVARRDDELSAWVGRGVRLQEAAIDVHGTYESPIDADDEDGHPWVKWSGPEGSFHDSARTQVSLVSTATIGDWDVRRFRPNVLVDGRGEDDLVGHRIRVGTVELDVVKQIDRCVMTTRPQPGLDRDLSVLRTINRERATFLGVGGVVVTPGRVAVGDSVVAATATRGAG